jgi:hypothetical protein
VIRIFTLKFRLFYFVRRFGNSALRKLLQALRRQRLLEAIGGQILAAPFLSSEAESSASLDECQPVLGRCSKLISTWLISFEGG